MRARSWTSALTAALAVLLTATALAADRGGEIGPAQHLTGNGRLLTPAGRLTALGNFPTGSALTPDGRFLWAVDSGHGADDVKVVELASGRVVQTLPLPGGYGGVVIAHDGRRAYVSGEAASTADPAPPAAGPMLGAGGDVVHVYDVDPATGRATERDPFSLPATKGGSGQVNSLPPTSKGWPEGLALTPDGKTLVVALNQADQVALVNTATGAARLVRVGRYPFGAAVTPDGKTALVSNEYDGTVSFVDLASGTQTATVGVGGDRGNLNAHPEAIEIDAARRRAYVAVANRDLVAAIDLGSRRVVDQVSVARGVLGVQPVGLALSADAATLYAADEGEDALAVIDLAGRGAPGRSAGTARAGTTTKPMQLVGRIPTAAFPTDVEVLPDGAIAWVASKGFGAGPNPGFVFGGSKSPSGNVQTPYGEYVPDKLLGYAGVLSAPGTSQLAALTARADRQVIPTDAKAPPPGTPVISGGPIKHVFYVVRENRTYDQIFGSDPRGDGDPSLELFDDNGVAGPTGGITPNAHALARRFPLLDHVYADSEVSVDGHLITAGSLAIDYAQRALHANYSGRGRAFDFGIFPVSFGPNAFVFDQAVRQGVTFRNYGEQAAGNLPTANDGRPTYGPVVAGTDNAYAGNAQIGCLTPPAGVPASCTRDSSPTLSMTNPGFTGPVPGISANSRMDVFANELRAQDAAGTVPTFNYLILPNDHTNGTTAGDPTPQAEIADNDLGLGQLVDAVSHSSIWSSSAIIVVEDDTQDGADHVDAHRMPALVISPWARTGAVVSDRYDQYSALRTAEILAGLRPLSINDAQAVPMYDAFRTDGRPDLTPYQAIKPSQDLAATNSSSSPAAGLSAKLPFGQLDLVPQALSDEVLWRSVHGDRAKAPPPGPNASPEEHARAVVARRLVARGLSPTRYLRRTGG
jgi:YVTN family beta-propeller protein